MTERLRELRRLAPFEALAVVAIAVAPLPAMLPVAAPLLAVASVSRWLRGRGWGELVRGTHARVVALGALVGVVAIAATAPVLNAFRVTAVEWWLVPATRGELEHVGVALLLVTANAIALELALRGWIVERMLELSPGPPALPIVTGALAEALVIGGPLPSRLGAALFGAGLGVLYTANGRRVFAPAAARIVFVIGSVLVEALR